MQHFEEAANLITLFKGDAYLGGMDILGQSGSMVARGGKKAAFVIRAYRGSESHLQTIRDEMTDAGVEIVAELAGAGPNAPRADLFRMAEDLSDLDYDVLVSFGGGSNIDAAKAADVLVRLGGKIDDYFGTGLVTKTIEESGRTLTPHVAFQTVASSAAHLTKYSNITGCV
jgi:alcohol dehydrogenase class IV